jgi:dolichol-phosphate mannosyltransferase
MRLSIVVPVYREGEGARPTLAALAARAPGPHEILVVHDEADDPTVPVVADLRREHPQVRAVHNTLGRGPAWALRAGFAAASGPAVLVTMADASDDIGDIAPMLARLEAGDDLVAASRYMPGGRQIGGPPVKGLLSRVAGRSLHALIGLPTSDPTSAFKLYRRAMLERLTLESETGFELALEITIKAFFAGYRIGEVPTTWHDRVVGESNFKLMRWLPRYLRWYGLALRKGLIGGRAGVVRAPL